jgi:hypothetical protein
MAAGPLLHTFVSKAIDRQEARNMKQIIRTMRVTAAPAIVAVALLAACGSGDSGEAERVDASTRPRLEAQAERYEWSAHLEGQAKTYGAPTERQHSVGPNPDDAGNRAAAERLEREAKLEGLAETHGRSDPSDDAPAPPDETSNDEFVPGSGHMPTR